MLIETKQTNSFDKLRLTVKMFFSMYEREGVGRKEEVGERERGREREREARGKRERGREREIGGRYTNDGCTYPGDPRWGHIDVQQLCVGDEGYTSRCRRGFRGEQVRQV